MCTLPTPGYMHPYQHPGIYRPYTTRVCTAHTPPGYVHPDQHPGMCTPINTRVCNTRTTPGYVTPVPHPGMCREEYHPGMCREEYHPGMYLSICLPPLMVGIHLSLYYTLPCIPGYTTVYTLHPVPHILPLMVLGVVVREPWAHLWEKPSGGRPLRVLKSPSCDGKAENDAHCYSALPEEKGHTIG